LYARHARCGLLVVTLFVVAFPGGADGIRLGGFALSWLRRAESSQAGVTRTVRATTTTGRQRAYYFPAHPEGRALPLMVGFHGTGGKGSLMTLRLQGLAEREGFIVLAPDSVSVAGVWMVGQRPDEVTEDYRHVMACVHEVLAAPGVRADSERVLAVGFSVGGSVAPYLATHENVFTAFGILHGHVVLGSLGSRRPRVWLSAGDRDRVRTVEYMRGVADYLKQKGFLEVEPRVFRVDHTLQDEELTALVVWWLGQPVGRR
jgi:poly(3-hydroxybutyrate) depolymerase